MPDTRSRARLSILHYITSFCLTHDWGPKVGRRGSLHGFISDMRSDEPSIVGDLVVLQSAPISKWYLSWLVEIDPATPTTDARYLLASIEDGALCWWTNVGIDHLDRKCLEEHREWTWTDRQFAFKDRWWRVCFKERDAYLKLPTYPEFGADGSVTLGMRERWGGLTETKWAPRKSFPDWRKVTKAQMRAFYDECVGETAHA